MTKSWLSLLALGAVAIDHVVAAAEPRVVRMPLTKVATRTPPLRKRASPQSVTLGNAALYYLYYVNATVGSPGQEVALQIDTGSSDVWMFGPQVCNTEEGQELCMNGYFDPSSSNTYKMVGEENEFQIQYVTPGSGVVGDYFQDDFSIGGIKLSGLTMAVASKASAVNTGIMGIGYDSDESIVGTEGPSSVYPNIIDVMVNQSVISSHSYSLYLDDREADTGSVLFGGYDTAKYSDPLTVLDIQVDSQTNAIDSFTVVWSFLGVTPGSGSGSTTLLSGDQFPLPAVLDSGTSLTVIPKSIFTQLQDYFNATYGGEDYGYLVPCSNANIPGSLDFGFGGPNGAVIQVPFSELALPTGDEDTTVCSFGLDVAQDDSPILLGDTFLRSAYVIYDLDANQVAIAQANYNSTDSNIKEIPAGTDLASILGSAATAATGVSATQTASGQVAPGFGASNSGKQPSPTTLGTGSGSHSLSGTTTTLHVSSLLTNSPAATNIAGGAANPASSSTSSHGSAAAAGPVPSFAGIMTLFYTAFAFFASGAVMVYLY